MEQEGIAPERGAGAGQPDARDLEVLYRATDRLYYEMARDCGLSDTAYWVLYEVVYAGGEASQRELVQVLCQSRQTVNSALKTLEAKGLVELGFEEGSRKCKTVRLTEDGEAFCRRMVCPAMEAEARAFRSLSAQDQRELVRLVGAYADAVAREHEALHAARMQEKEDEEGER